MKRILSFSILWSFLAFGSLPSLAQSTSDLTNGLVAYYPFNGNSNDESGNGNNGDPGTAQLATDRFGTPQSAYLFNGVDSFITFPTTPTHQVDNVSMFCWLKPAKLPQWGVAVTLGTADGNLPCDGYGLGIGDASVFGRPSGARLLGENACVSWVDGVYTFPSTNDWHHVGFIRKNGNDYFYADGQLVATQAVAAPSPPTQFTIGTLLGSDRFTKVFQRFYRRCSRL